MGTVIKFPKEYLDYENNEDDIEKMYKDFYSNPNVCDIINATDEYIQGVDYDIAADGHIINLWS